ncbi:MAG: NAD(+)/NADH kinase [Defluviitaleaceae bacterium]|nr:NAD(+)/NADH kinase [Defluviitaleaceae bacterium]
MQSIKIIANQKRDTGLVYANEVRDYLIGRGYDADIIEPCKQASPALFCVVLGGDGTMLRVAHYAAIYDTPMIGINLGNLGFLTDVDKAQGITALSNILEGRHVNEKRIMLESEFGTDEIIPIQQRLSLNEVCLGNMGKLGEYSIYVNEQHMVTMRADAIIVSTPTGSTAYNLAAGGPILVSGGQMVVITPVCPHSLSARPLVVGTSDTVRVVAKQNSSVRIDGNKRGTVLCGESIFIKTSHYRATILKTTYTNFYSTLRKKKLL